MIDVERLEGGVISLCGAGGVREAMQTGFLLAGLRINTQPKSPLAGFITPCVAVWDRSGSFTNKCLVLPSFRGITAVRVVIVLQSNAFY